MSRVSLPIRYSTAAGVLPPPSGSISAAEDDGMRDRTEPTRDRAIASPDVASGSTAPAQDRADGAGRQRAAPGASGGEPTPLDKVDDASDDSFPASDAPAWTGIRVGSPRSDR